MQDEMNDLQMPYTDPNSDDLVRVVRCRYCQHNPSEKGVGWIFCPMTGKDTRKPDDFCSYGARKERSMNE